MPTLLILGGTAEARALAARAVTLPDWRVITSLAGRTGAPRLPDGETRLGGFGGAAGLRDYLRVERVDRVIDATHPFAARISAAATAACAALTLPRLCLRRARWRPRPDDRWLTAADPAEAARLLAGLGRRVLVSSGRYGLDALATPALAGHRLIVRLVEPPPPPLANAEPLYQRGPFDADAEYALLRQLRIDTLLSKNSGGCASYGKMIAARRLRLPVVMFEPPPPPPGARTRRIDAALRWLTAARRSR